MAGLTEFKANSASQPSCSWGLAELGKSFKFSKDAGAEDERRKEEGESANSRMA